LFNKYLGDKLICVRTSEYDDIFNHVDNLLIDKESGEIICALDEVAAIFDKRYMEKLKKVRSTNTGNGAITRYAITYNGTQIIPVINIEGLPLVLIALPEVALWKAIDKLDFEKMEVYEDYERNILEHFMTIIGSIIDILESEIKLLERQGIISEKTKVMNDRKTKLQRLKELIYNKLKEIDEQLEKEKKSHRRN